MKWGVKCASAPAPSLCDAPVTSAPVVSRNLLICSKPVAASPLWPTRAPSRNGVALAWRFWPTFSVIFTSSAYGGDTCSAIAWSAVYPEGSAAMSALSSTRRAVATMPRSCSASAKTISAEPARLRHAVAGERGLRIDRHVAAECYGVCAVAVRHVGRNTHLVVAAGLPGDRVIDEARVGQAPLKHPVHCVTRRQQPRGAMSKGFTGSRVGPAEVIRRVCGPRSPVDVQASACYRRGVMGEYQIEAAGW